MIETFYGLDALGSPAALVVALCIGVAFGTALEQAGFGSSRRLAGIFYFRDMTVLKVMFTAVLTAMLGLSWLTAAGVANLDKINLLETIYGAQIVGGLLLGIGFVMGGWCPGTAAVGLAGGRIDALLFLLGAMAGTALFNEGYAWFGGLTNWGNRGVLFIYDTLGVSRPVFALGFTMAGVVAFWGCELLERHVNADEGAGLRQRAPALTLVSVALILLAAGLLALPAIPATPIPAAATPASTPTSATPTTYAVNTPGAPADVQRETEMLATIEAAADHLDPEDLADRMVAGEAGLVVVDVRPESEFHAGHLRGAVNIPLPRLVDELTPVKNRGTIVLYSNGMTHPAQARDTLARLGFTNVFLLTDGLDGFFARCLKPVSLRREPLAPADAARITRWRQYFLAGSGPHPPATPAAIPPASTSGFSALPADQGGRVAAASVWPTSIAPVIHLPGLVEPDWLTANLGKPGLCIVDLRAQPEYNAGHAPGAVSLHIESLRGMVGGVPSMLLPADMLARQFGQLGVNTTDVVVFVHGDKVHDATLAGLALERLGHRYWGVLHGGHSRWETEKRPLTRQLPRVTATSYPVPTEPDRFTVGIDVVAKAAADQSALIVDVRPAEFFTGAKSDEARAGHIPGARSRPHLDDLDKQGEVARFKTIADLTAAWQQIGVRLLAQPERAPGTAAALEKPVILHCRTGHQASQAYFVLKHLLGYRDVSWYDGGWTEWASRSDLPSEATP